MQAEINARLPHWPANPIYLGVATLGEWHALCISPEFRQGNALTWNLVLRSLNGADLEQGGEVWIVRDDCLDNFIPTEGNWDRPSAIVKYA